MRKSLTILPCMALLSSLCGHASTEEDSILIQQMQYNDYNYLHNVSDGSLNPVSISDLPLRQLSVLSAGYSWRDGSYHNVDASDHADGFNVDAYGIKRMDKIAFEGGVAYYNTTDRARCWNSTLFQDKLNPFILADFEPSDYNTERFRVNGRMSYRLSQRFKVGINADYNVGVTSDEKDPRVETKGMRFILNPGVQWNATSRLSIGATGGIDLFNESSHYTCLATAVNFKFYLMTGLGSYFPQTGSSYIRDAKGVSWFAGLDFKYRFSEHIQDYLYVSFGHNDESATDGGSTYQFKGGNYMNDVVKIHNRFSITSSRMAHNVEINVTTNAVKGKWYDQKGVTENGTTHYEVMNVSVKHKETRTSAKAGYRFDLLDRNGVSSFTAGVSASATMSDTKNYPEMYFCKYTRLDIAFNAMKHFQIKRIRMGVGIDGGYGTCLSSSCDFAGLELEDTYSMPVYSYLTSSAIAARAKVQAKMPVGQFILGAYLSGGTTHCISGKLGYNGRNMASLDCGISMTF